MLKFFSLSLCACSLVVADSGSLIDFETAEPIHFSQDDLVRTPLQEAPVVEKKLEPKKVVKTDAAFTPFTGKVKGKKVRIRLQADLDSRVIKELSKDELVSIIGEKDDFWAVSPPRETKAYVFRSFVLDNVVEGNRVNVRLEPHLEAPIIAHLNSGDRLDNPIISSINNKWFEIAPPAQTKFYVAKEYVEYAGGPELKAQADRRLLTCQQLLEATAVLSQAELRKPFEEMDFDRIANNYNTVIKDYAEFEELAEAAKQALSTFQEHYLEKRIAYLEAKSSAPQLAEEEKKQSLLEELSETISQVTDKMRVWEPIEESLYIGWENFNSGGTIHDFYEDQKLSSAVITGIVEPYNSPVKNKPGDFILRDKEIPVAYLYSTQINLQSLVGKRVSVIVSARPNHNFAFPAYYVLSIE